MRSCRTTLAAVALALAFALPLDAHHSFGMFDSKKEMWLDGTITLFQWANPHTFIHVRVEPRNEKGDLVEGAEAVEWSLEGGSPNILARNGWKRTSLKAGEHVRVLIYPLRDGKPGGAFIELHKDDGTVLYYHG